jgi:MoxR-like ATPase
MTTYVEIAAKLRTLQAEVAKVVVGKEAVLERACLALAAEGHVLLEDNPGLAKTLMVKSFSQALGLPFRRVQFTPDLLPADITGSFFFNLQANKFEIRKGPIFTSFLLADEINRAPPKTQSALLEAMQERQTTLEGETHALPSPFFVFATQNPIEIEGTYPLPEAQLDRFLMRLSVGYPSPAAEVEMLRRRDAAKQDETKLAPVMSVDELRAIQRATEQVRLDDANKEYIVRLVNATRQDPRLQLGASPRGSLALFKLGKAHAMMQGRGYVVPDDIKAIAEAALAHRLVVRPEMRVRGLRAEQVVQEALRSVPAPAPPAPTSFGVAGG